MVVNHSYDYRTNCSPLSPVAITKISLISFYGLPWQNKIKKNATVEPLNYGHLGDRKKWPPFCRGGSFGGWGGGGGWVIKHFKGVHYVYCGKIMLNVSV